MARRPSQVLSRKPDSSRTKLWMSLITHRQRIVTLDYCAHTNTLTYLLAQADAGCENLVTVAGQTELTTVPCQESLRAPRKICLAALWQIAYMPYVQYCV